ncbi:hypothetical protein BO82DRAFT_402008 [Aspergillus uvarum CBS 121591]|uniref:Cytochrome P450 n=1 Tax=Aspergillus uvarum CBS 121591 TaxID=1448315 RepID=A0A319DRE6_9EURO|nr:hypothetical protein BO82DRAFT_402008 [Aspergillus uvarum CBS 121591]PYH81782.1 hypothetical protein BO82DRAFT_402008 [Aspergillus uvarum CBS 121591]
MGAANDFAHRAMGTILASWLWLYAVAILILALRDRHGPIVRTDPYPVSFNTAQGFKEVYGSQPGVAQFPRDLKTYGPMIPTRDSVWGPISNEAHRRQWRLLAHAFSDRALREQEPRVSSFIDLSISRLRDLAHQSTDIDIRAWLEFAAFDITGDLMFAETFGCLQDGQPHPWMEFIFNSVKGSAILSAIHQSPALAMLQEACTPA